MDANDGSVRVRAGSGEAVSERSGSTPVYSIGAVSRMTGVPVPTIRNWEDRYGVVLPQRSAGGQRLYSRDEIEQLQFIARQLGEGLSPADAHRMLVEGLAGGEEGGISSPPRHRIAILLAERDPYAAEFAEFFLRTEGYEVKLAFDPSDAAAISESLGPDLIVVEWLIAGGSGAQLCRDLKAQSDRPILVISPLGARDAALDAGADAFLLKPFEPLVFVSTVKDLLGESAYLGAPLGVRA